MTDYQVYFVMVAGFAALVAMIADGVRKPQAWHFVGAFVTAGAWFGLCLSQLVR